MQPLSKNCYTACCAVCSNCLKWNINLLNNYLFLFFILVNAQKVSKLWKITADPKEKKKLRCLPSNFHFLKTFALIQLTITAFQFQTFSSQSLQ